MNIEQDQIPSAGMQRREHRGPTVDFTHFREAGLGLEKQSVPGTRYCMIIHNENPRR